ncbi:SGNH/GDSL hydrolase family protein [Jeotgalibacillus haloalkalitolerans]|uniref:SGNH/GDSL hydrolase family protein n=1 Tax=Jeotgalibacillus haloalkalitolerans TaxID=3104292 RepID=A0ABU5KPI9_9BACL|nr:SGNH/GDSL hydrolase family protein [Jeotgalibacillus sp. HH7-29]MDZ5712651.1 SGNH/GDSL hydrolase family protein [Jeotgalibacillus sp. HH7-29]
MLRLVCFGDSITARHEGFTEPMLTAKLTALLKNTEVINAGVAGDNTNDALKRIENDVIQYNPDFVTVLFGANDAAFHKMIDIETYRSNLYQITQLLKPERTIIISSSPVDEKVQFTRTNEILSEYAAAAEQVAKDTGSYFIDFFSYMLSLEDYPEYLKGLMNDGLHFGEAGYHLLAGLIQDKINEIS